MNFTNPLKAVGAITMMEPKLVRICALAIAAFCQTSTNRHRTDDIIDRAKEFARYIDGRA